MSIFYHLSGGDPLKFDDVAELNYIFVLSFLSLEKKRYLKEKREEKKYKKR
jgi:hypothetical protein